MTIPDNCIARVADTVKERGVSKAAVKDVAAEVDRLEASARAAGEPPGAAYHKAGRDYAERVQLAAMIEKRNATINALRFQAVSEYVGTVWKGKETEGLRSVLTGSIEGRKGARASVAREQQALSMHYVGRLDTALRRDGVRDIFRSGVLDQDVARALWQLNSKTPVLDGLPADAVKVARAINDVQELARMHANQAGAFIGKLEGWVVRQAHDPYKITHAGEQAWIADVAPRLDWARIEAERGPIADKARWLSEVYTSLATGQHQVARAEPGTQGFKGSRNVAKSMSQERVLHFRSADDWFAYNQTFGPGNLREAVMRGLTLSGQNTGIMRVLGTNPEAMFDRLVQDAMDRMRSRGDRKGMEKLAAASKEMLRNRLDEVTGAVRQTANHTISRWAATARSAQSMAKLGGAVISSITDLANYASELRFQGRGFLSGIGEGISALVQGRPDVERREILSSLGVYFDSIIGDLTRTGSLDESLPGAVGRLQAKFFDLNLLNWWTDSLRGGAGLSMSHHLALNATKAWDDLAPDLRRTLELYSIAEQDWNHMRAGGVKKAADGTEFMVPDELPAPVGDKLRRYVSDRAYTAVLEPDADARAMMRQGTRPGTAKGELFRFIMQFKGYPIGYARQVMGREVFGYGERAFAQGSIGGIATLMASTTALGYAAMTVKDLLKGRNPRDPEDPNTMVAAMLQGGGAGIYGDFLFGDYSRFGRTPLESLAGPVPSLAAETLALAQGLARGNRDAGDALRLAINNTPFMNLFYTRIALDYLFLYSVQEAVSPGTLQRMQSRIEQQNGQTFWLPPTEAVQ